MVYVLGALAFIIVLMLIVTIHEMGHFLMAKRAKILCYEFSLGMGPLIYRKKCKETYFSIRAIPIGGFVSPAGEDGDQDYIEDGKDVKLELDDSSRVVRIIHNVTDEKYKDLPLYRVISHDLFGTLEALPDELFVEVAPINEDESLAEATKFIVNRDCIVEFKKKEEYQIAPKNRSMSSKSVGARFLTIFGGPFMNFLLALVLYFIIGLFQGYPQLNKTKLNVVDKNAPVYGILQEDDEILSINGTQVSKWNDISTSLADIASGNVDTFNGSVKVEYKDKDGNVKTALIYPAVSVYSIELMLNQDETKNNKVVVGEYSSNNTKTKSYKAGLRKGDVLTSIKVKTKSESTTITTINDLLKFFTGLNESCDVEITYSRDGEAGTAVIETYSKDLLESQGVTQTKVQLGVSPQYEFDFGKLLYMPWANTAESSIGIFKTLGLLFTDSSVHIDDFSGPVGIFQLITNTVSSGILPLLSLMAYLSVNIGFVNLLPLPALDGGRLVFIIYEAITKKKPSQKVENIVHTVGFLLLMALFVFITFNDVLRLFGCK